MTDPLATAKADAAKASAAVQAGAAQAVATRNMFLDFVSSHPKTACFIIGAQTVAVVILLLARL